MRDDTILIDRIEELAKDNKRLRKENSKRRALIDFSKVGIEVQAFALCAGLICVMATVGTLAAIAIKLVWTLLGT